MFKNLLIGSKKNFVQKYKVKTNTIDNIFSKIKLKNSLLKIDVEGFEMEVLKGAAKTLEHVQYLMIELNNNTKKYGSSNLEIEKYLSKKGFKIMIKVWPDVVWRKKGKSK